MIQTGKDPILPQERTAQEMVKSASQVFLPNQGEGREGEFSPATCSSLTACPQFGDWPCIWPCVCRVYTDQYTSVVKCLLDEKLNWAGGGKWYRWRNNLLWEELKGQVERFKTQISIGTASNPNEWSRQVVNNKEWWGLQQTEGRML